MKIKPLHFAGAALGLVVLGWGGFSMWLSGQGDNKDFAVNTPRLIQVKPGMSTGEIAQLLHSKQLVKNPSAFKLQARMDGLAEKLQAGVYQIDGGLSNKDIVNVMSKGKVQTLHFNVPEGYNVRKIAAKLEVEGLGKADKFLAAAKDYAPYEYMKTDNPAIKYKAEGYVYPATYDFPYGISEEEILKIMVKTFNEQMVSSGVQKTCQERGLKLQNVVNMAAMVELEAVFPEEQPRIAGVFLKRLEIGMPIQSDTTVQYLFDKQKEVVLYKDLEIDSPYNTYKYPGLPVGPIGNPSLRAIKAVLEPEKHDYLYFVAEKDGHHRFTKTFEEHNKAIKEIG